MWTPVWRALPWVCLGLLMSSQPLVSQSGELSQDPDKQKIREALEFLNEAPTGAELIRRAGKEWGLRNVQDLLQKIEWGQVSKTDAVLVRHFNPETLAEHRERSVTILLRRDQPLEDLVLDLAHEMTHAVAGPSWDPYDPSLNAIEYVWRGIEGEGGEVDALVGECQIGVELAERLGGLPSRCERYLTRAAAAPKIDRGRVLRDFYRVGRWKKELIQRLKPEAFGRFALLSEETPVLYSSTGQAPYPLALYREFQEMTSIACENSRRRLSSLSSSSSGVLFRQPAELAPLREQTRRFIKRRCVNP